MAAGFKVGPIFHIVGTGSFLHSFFSTVAVRLEGEKWGSKYPCIMRDLYNDGLASRDIRKAQKELKKIQKGLAKFPPGDMVWDFDDRTAKPPWGDNIAPTITSLANYFITSGGKDLFATLEKALAAGQELGEDVRIEAL